jgi:hypothetical protein
MKSELARLVVNRVIIHEIPRHLKASGGSGPVYSKVESELKPEMALYFRDKITKSLGSTKSYDISLDPVAQSPFPGLLKKYLDAPRADFVEVSQKMAEHLHNIQDGTNAGGLLAVIDCAVGDDRAVGIIKLEKEEGVNIKQMMLKGLPTFDLQVLKSLVLTEKTRIYKVALFVALPGSDEYDAAASDNQTGYGSYNELASFFLKRFLGCKLKKEPIVATSHFFEAAKTFFNEVVDDPEKRVQYHDHVVSEMLSQSPTISSEQFAETYLPVDLRQRFVSHLEAKEVPANFPKNTELINRRLKKTLYEFGSGIQVIVPNEQAESHIKLTKLEGGETKVEIQDRLKEVKGK